VYTLIPHPLLDPTIVVAMEDVQVFYKQFFWCNNTVWKCCCAALALAKRGENIDRLFIGISPGGVGQSLHSLLLHAMHEGSAAFFDPNVWYNDEELRKQVEQWSGCFLLTGQESPENTRRMREDLFKKTMSGDAVAGRKPYGYSTKMLELVGWKRLECNRMFRFSSVSERNFHSILRRSFVWTPKARFFDKSYLQERYPDSAADGIFPADDTLRDRLRSGPCVAAALRIQHAFELENSRQQCRELIESWVLGEDCGLTERTLRQACGLAPRPHTAQGSK